MTQSQWPFQTVQGSARKHLLWSHSEVAGLTAQLGASLRAWPVMGEVAVLQGQRAAYPHLSALGFVASYASSDEKQPIALK